MSRAPTIETLLAEIAEQPAVVARLVERQAPLVARLARAIERRAPRAVVMVARGSSDNAAVYGRYLFEIRNRLLVSLAAPSTVTLYERGPDLSDALVIGVSQSGRGEDVVAYLRAARAQGAATVAIVNDAAAPLAEAAEWVLDCLAGPELSVPATKSVTAQMTALAMLSAALADGDRFPSVLDTLPDAVDRAHARRSEARALARTLAGLDVGAVVGRGFAYPVALELALKLKETTYRRAEPFSAADFFHGPVALVEAGYAALVVDVGGRSTAPALAVCAEVRRRRGQPFLLRAGRSESAPAEPPTLSVPGELDEPHAAIPALVLGQLVAIELALALGIDPSQPRGLRKITSTR